MHTATNLYNIQLSSIYFMALQYLNYAESSVIFLYCFNNESGFWVGKDITRHDKQNHTLSL